MADDARARQIAEHIESVASRAERDTRWLASTLMDACWPGDARDRAEPAALDWLRGWGAAGITPVPLACSCRLGRCRLCN